MTSEDFKVHRLFAIAQIAATLQAGRTDEPKAAIATALEIIQLAEREILGPEKEPKSRSLPERLHLVRLLEKLRANTLDSEERLELAELIKASL